MEVVVFGVGLAAFMLVILGWVMIGIIYFKVVRPTDKKILDDGYSLPFPIFFYGTCARAVGYALIITGLKTKAFEYHMGMYFPYLDSFKDKRFLKIVSWILSLSLTIAFLLAIFFFLAKKVFGY
ncbi:MAG: hypothetical protein HRU19_30835 [Pseudobacteriovorax sp.]|nr:hypothetical protein [Pseudobacteriovorax sp.]